MAGHRYWRLQGQHSANGNYSLGELGFRTSAGGPNVYGSTITNGSYSGYPASNAFDSDTATGWLSTASDAWAGQDFGTDVDIVEYAITAPHYASGMAPAAVPDQFTLSCSDDGVSWTARDTRSVATWTYEEARVYAISADGTFPVSGFVNAVTFGIPTGAVIFLASGFLATGFGAPSNARQQAAIGSTQTAFGAPRMVPSSSGFLVVGPAQFGHPFALQVMPPSLAQLGLAKGFVQGRFGTTAAGWRKSGVVSGFHVGALGTVSAVRTTRASGFGATAFGALRTGLTQHASSFRLTAYGTPRMVVKLSVAGKPTTLRFGLPATLRSNTFATYGIHAAGRFGRPTGFVRFNHPASGFLTGARGVPVCARRHRVALASPETRFGKALLRRNPTC